MGSKPNFGYMLELPPEETVRDAIAAGEEIPGPEASGPVEPGEMLHWIYVWIVQNGKDDQGNTWAAAADGESPEDTEATRGARDAWKEETKKNNMWKIKTDTPHATEPLKPGAAIATAMALVDRIDGTTDVYLWSEGVLLTRRKPPPSSAT
jgi:hypothetical protein